MRGGDLERELRRLRPGDLVAVPAPTGPGWPGLVRLAWAAGAAVLPVDPRLPEPAAAALIGAARPAARLDGTELRRLRGGEPVADGVGLVMPSSGTTGPPKLAELPREALRAAVSASARRLGATPSDPWLGWLPVAHMGGMLVVLRAALLGAPATLRPRFDPGELDAFVRGRGGFTAVVPTMLRRLLDAGAPVHLLRAVLVGAGGTDPGLAARAAAADAPIVRTYGMTESCGGVLYEGAPLEGVEVGIGPEGEVLLRGPTLMRGYRFDPEATARAIDGDGWLHTGDAGRLEDGILRVDGRLDDLIVTGGEKVWPEEVEAVLREHPAVADAAVGGVPDEEWGQRVVAFVVPALPGAPPGLEDLRSLIGERLSRVKAPRELRLVPEVPRTASGKVRHDLLRAGEDV